MIIFNFTIIVSALLMVTNIFNMHMYTTYIKSLIAVSITPEIVDALKTNTHHIASAKHALSEYTIYKFFWMPITILTLLMLGCAWWIGSTTAYTLSGINIFIIVSFLSGLITHMILRELPSPALLMWGAGLLAVVESIKADRTEKAS
jgi:hypothetical protein